MDAATCVNIDLSIALGDASPGTVRTYLLTHVAPCCHEWLHATANIGIDFPTFLGYALLRKAGEAMLKPVTALLFWATHCPTRTVRTIYADGCNCTQPQASTTHELCSRGDSGFQIVGFGRLGRHAPRRMVGARLLASATREPRVQG